MTAPLILVIDDEAPVRNMLRISLEHEGFRVVEAEDGARGMRLLRQEPPDLVITDLIMPEKEGLETIGEVRRDFPSVPVIAISGGGRAGTDGYFQVAQALGACRCLGKPFSRADLLSAVRDALGPERLPPDSP